MAGFNCPLSTFSCFSSEKPIVPIMVYNPANGFNVLGYALIDTGADTTVIPEFKQECPDCKEELSKVQKMRKQHYLVNYRNNCKTCNGTGKIAKSTYTCLAIGPDEAEKIDKITGELKLL